MGTWQRTATIATAILLLAAAGVASASPLRPPAAPQVSAWRHPLRAMRGWLEARRHRPDEQVGNWAAAAGSLYATDFASTFSKGVMPLRGLLKVTGPIGGVALMARSAACWRHAETHNERLDLAGDFAWGIQGCLYLSKATKGFLPLLGRGLGVVGASCQVVAGCRRVHEGFTTHDRSMMRLGALDIAAGALGVGLDLFALYNPVYFAGYLAVATAREVYCYRQPLGDFIRRHLPHRKPASKDSR